MIISDSSISMSSSRVYKEQTEIHENLKMWVGNRRPDFENELRPSSDHVKPKLDTVELSKLKPSKEDIIKAMSAESADEIELAGSDDLKVNGKDELKARMLERLIEVLTGERVTIEIFDPTKGCKTDRCANNASKAPVDGENQAEPQGEGWGVEYDYQAKHYEYEKTTFSAEGTVRTSDGKEINFAVDVSMSREFMEEHNISLRAGDAKRIDPLVIDFEGSSTELTQTKFSFDLDVDGVQDSVSFVNPNSGMLALDKNDDGAINDGSELFGPSTGNGFEELAQYDEDGNSWIDERDSVFKALLVWNKDDQGNDVISSIADKGIGAIYLGSQETQFAIKDQANQLQGQVASTGIYLNEDGSVGTVRQIDLAA